jgi:restriction endonuclease S subunit
VHAQEIRLAWTQYAQLPVVVPPLAEQRQIVAKVDELMTACDQLEQSLEAAELGRTMVMEAVLTEALSESNAEAEQVLATAH